jgi:hypothetical protein
VLFFATKVPSTTPPPQTIATFQGDPPPQGGCSQCLAGNCYAASCNLECRLLATGCETIVMGGAQQEYTPGMKASNGDYAEFYMQMVLKNNQSMQDAGIKYGDLITKVNGIYAGSDLEFAKLVLKLPKGTRLQVFRWVVKDGGAVPKTLEFVL